MTSPPYWGKREYANRGIGLEGDYRDFIRNLTAICAEVKRVLKPEGSFWLNIGDILCRQEPGRHPVAHRHRADGRTGLDAEEQCDMEQDQGGPDNTRDRLRNVHEEVFHFVKSSRGYYYDVDAIRSTPKRAKVVNDRWSRRRGYAESGTEDRSSCLGSHGRGEEKRLGCLGEDARSRCDRPNCRLSHDHPGPATDDPFRFGEGFRRAKELGDKGFYFLKYHPNGSKPSDVWDILPRTPRSERRISLPIRGPVQDSHSGYLPVGGLVLDPFCGTGTTMSVASILGRKSVGIDLASEYLAIAEQRSATLP